MPTLLARADLYPLPGFQDPVSSISHLLGAVVFLILGYRMLRREWGHRERVFYLAVYVAATVMLMALSGVYHMMEFGGTARKVMERLDHGAIFFLIAGTFTPAHGILMRGWAKWGFLILIWSAALTGITFKTIYFTYFPEGLGLTFYLGLGWLGAFSCFLLYSRFGLRFIAPLLWGGLFYTVGCVMEFLGWLVIIPGVLEAHELFHLFVLAGAACHWTFVEKIADGKVNGKVVMPHDLLYEEHHTTR